MKVLKNARVYAPNYLGIKDILVAGGKIIRIDDQIHEYDNIPEVEMIDIDGKRMIPGYIDLHVHITGGGGEQGPASRVPESNLSVLLKNGLTTVVGLLGTDGVTRSIENLIAKARALNEEGITCYALTGSYAFPTSTLLGNVERDITLIDVFVGAKIAMSDHRSSNPTPKELIEIGTQARRAGLMSGTAGLVTIHMGNGKAGLDPLFEALDQSDMPIKNFLPTHTVMRHQKLLDDSVAFVHRGGTIDITAGETAEKNREIAEKLKYCLDQGCPLSQITLSSDAYGSQPRFDEKGECIGLTYASPSGLHSFIKVLVEDKILPLEEAITLLTTNPARVLELSQVKGCIAVGADADFVVLDDELNISGVVAKGKVAVSQGKVLMKGRFEE